MKAEGSVPLCQVHPWAPPRSSWAHSPWWGALSRDNLPSYRRGNPTVLVACLRHTEHGKTWISLPDLESTILLTLSQLFLLDFSSFKVCNWSSTSCDVPRHFRYPVSLWNLWCCGWLCVWCRHWQWDSIFFQTIPETYMCSHYVHHTCVLVTHGSLTNYKLSKRPFEYEICSHSQ